MRFFRSVPVPVEPGGVMNPGAQTKGVGIDPKDTGGGDEPWTMAPGESHIWGFRYFDIRKYPALGKFPGKLGPVSLLYVRFRGKKGVDIAAECQYGFANPDAGKAIFDAMAAAAHPYADVFLPRVRKAGIPFQYV